MQKARLLVTVVLLSPRSNARARGRGRGRGRGQLGEFGGIGCVQIGAISPHGGRGRGVTPPSVGTMMKWN